MKTKIWIARDKNGRLYLYNSKPVLDRLNFAYFPSCDDMVNYMEIDKNSHPEITFKNSPKQIEI